MCIVAVKLLIVFCVHFIRDDRDGDGRIQQSPFRRAVIVVM